MFTTQTNASHLVALKTVVTLTSFTLSVFFTGRNANIIIFWTKCWVVTSRWGKKNDPEPPPVEPLRDLPAPLPQFLQSTSVWGRFLDEKHTPTFQSVFSLLSQNQTSLTENWKLILIGGATQADYWLTRACHFIIIIFMSFWHHHCFVFFCLFAFYLNCCCYYLFFFCFLFCFGSDIFFFLVWK